ncbi:hypothetical protein SAMN05877753_1204 [Bacillus oleivorans]|uniref:Uncharacterized protein n=1 Tax=Bacillus oleivorans TaxID=1448271 RepID=A0A285D9C2_9BACI|nr:hypothetical protein [Bacillus oleivorans]SNX75858.1 hypothetical protein SAMN05877753_1204 [Bacillus oleivorans]
MELILTVCILGFVINIFGMAVAIKRKEIGFFLFACAVLFIATYEEIKTIQELVK